MNENKEITREEKLKLWKIMKNKTINKRKEEEEKKEENEIINYNIKLKKKNKKKFIFYNSRNNKKEENENKKINKENERNNQHEEQQQEQQQEEEEEEIRIKTPKKKKQLCYSIKQSPYFDGYITANEDLFENDNQKISYNYNNHNHDNNNENNNNNNKDKDNSNDSLLLMNQKLINEIDNLKKENKLLKQQLNHSNELKNEAIEVARMNLNEIECWVFDNDILTQKYSQLEEQIKRERMRNHEKENHKMDKYKDEINRLKSKNQEYERRANDMVAEMTQQMTQLQDMAMLRIEQLEQELLQEQHKTETLQNNLNKLSTQQKKQKYIRRRTNTLKSSLSPLSTLPDLSLTPKMYHGDIDDDGNSEEEDDSMTAGTRSEDENDIYLLNHIDYTNER